MGRVCFPGRAHFNSTCKNYWLDRLTIFSTRWLLELDYMVPTALGMIIGDYEESRFELKHEVF